MKRRTFLGAAPALAAAQTQPQPRPRAGAIANDFVAVYESPDPANIYAMSPGIARLPTGRLVATMNLSGAGAAKLPGARRDGRSWLGKIFTSDDRGRTWQHRADVPISQGRPFAAGDSIYVIGQSGDLVVVRSRDNGTTWSEPADLSSGQHWHQAPSNVVYARDRVYLVMERITDPKAYYQSVLAPVLMSARVSDDLTRRDAWVFSSELTFRQAWDQAGPARLVGVPFYKVGYVVRNPVKGRVKREMFPLSWLETNVVQFTDPDHVWYDPTGHTFHLWLRAHTGATNMACILKVVESPDARALTVSLEQAPSGETMLYVPCPGGQMKFHVLYDDRTRLYWLLSSQSTDSMKRVDSLPFERFDLPNNERHRLALHFSRNCVDWCFAALVADSGHPDQGRHYASMAIDGADLHVLSRSGDHRAKNAHDGNLITFHTVRDFRSLVY
jgi:hypothetical protein